MSPLSVPNFTPIRARIRVLWRILRSVRNEEEVEEKLLAIWSFLFSCPARAFFVLGVVGKGSPSSPGKKKKEKRRN